MRVEVKFVCLDIVGSLRSGDYDIPEGATIAELLEISRAECTGSDIDIRFDNLIFMRNGKPARLDTKIAAGDKIHVMREVFGG